MKGRMRRIDRAREKRERAEEKARFEYNKHGVAELERMAEEGLIVFANANTAAVKRLRKAQRARGFRRKFFMFMRKVRARVIFILEGLRWILKKIRPTA